MACPGYPKAAARERLPLAGKAMSRPSLAAVIQSSRARVAGLEVVGLNQSTLSRRSTCEIDCRDSVVGTRVYVQ